MLDIVKELQKSPDYKIPSSKKPFIIGLVAVSLIVFATLSLFWSLRGKSKLAVFMLGAIVILFATLILVFFLVSKKIGAKRRLRVKELRKLVARIDEEKFIHRDIKLDLSQYGSYLIVKLIKQLPITVTSSDLDDIGEEVTLAIDTSAESRNLVSSRLAVVDDKKKKIPE